MAYPAPLEVLIVGAGHYARNLISPKYRKNPGIHICGVVSSSATDKSLETTSLSGVTIYKTIEDFILYNGRSSIAGIIADLCLHQTELNSYVEKMVEAGFRNFILPKPIASTEDELHKFSTLRDQYGLKISVASQWFYSEIVRELHRLIGCHDGKVTAELNFEQCFSAAQREKYITTNALLPHMLQIIHTTNICNLSKEHETVILDQCEDYLKIKIRPDNSSFADSVILYTDLTSQNKRRELTVYSEESRASQLLSADFLGHFDDDGNEIHRIYHAGKGNDIIEDNLLAMTEEHVRFWQDDNYTGSFLSFERYLPVAKEQIRINRMLKDLRS
ncbi:MAG: hypothetical protein JNL74_02460 [Fibrobacteres bacterium]|nr:hypothetical protein [Fibrobacterota bacterium]